jgi:hypothetical protein
MTTFCVRIKPGIACASYNEFFKKKGWYEVDSTKADWCRQARLHDLSQDAPLVFDVCSREEAAGLELSERKRVDPAGTSREPISMVEAAPADRVSDPSQSRGRGRREGASTEGA